MKNMRITKKGLLKNKIFRDDVDCINNSIKYTLNDLGLYSDVSGLVVKFLPTRYRYYIDTNNKWDEPDNLASFIKLELMNDKYFNNKTETYYRRYFPGDDRFTESYINYSKYVHIDSKGYAIIYLPNAEYISSNNEPGSVIYAPKAKQITYTHSYRTVTFCGQDTITNCKPTYLFRPGDYTLGLNFKDTELFECFDTYIKKDFMTEWTRKLSMSKKLNRKSGIDLYFDIPDCKTPIKNIRYFLMIKHLKKCILHHSSNRVIFIAREYVGCSIE